MKTDLEIFHEYLPLVDRALKTVHFASNVDIDAVRSQGRIGLWKAIGKYDENKGNVSAFLFCRIKYAMLEEVREQDPISRRQIDAIKRGEFTRPFFVPLEDINEREAPHTYATHIENIMLSDEINYLLGFLPDPKRSMVRLRYLCGESLVEIGRRFDVTSARISQHIKESFQLIQKRLT